MNDKSTQCSQPIDWAKLVAYFSRELPPDDEAALEEHFFECASCAQSAEAVARLVERLGQATPPALGDDLFETLRKAESITTVVGVDPAGVVVLPFEGPSDVVVCELRGDFAGYGSVDLELESYRESGRISGAPVSSSGDRVRLVCQTAFAERFGRTVHVIVRPPGAPGESLAKYQLEHEIRSE